MCPQNQILSRQESTDTRIQYLKYTADTEQRIHGPKIKMRMTRAALRAQAQNSEETEFQHWEEDEQGSLPLQSRQSTTLIHEDYSDTEKCLDSGLKEESPVRLVLRDITDENYPQAEIEADGLESQSVTPLRKSIVVLGEEQEELSSTRKSTRKGRPKAKGRPKKKVTEPVVLELQDQEDLKPAESELQVHVETNVAQSSSQPVYEEVIIEPQPGTTDEHSLEPPEAIDTDEQVDKDFEHDLAPSISRTPRFDPAIQSPNTLATAGTTEDSFLNSIRKSSPAKSPFNQRSPILDSVSNSLRAVTPIRRTSSTNFEDSFEAFDSLEDTIEQLTAGLPILPAETLNSPESPVKTVRRSLKPQLTATPNSSVPRTPRSSVRKTASMLSMGEKDKENAPPVSRTPLSKAKTPLKARTPATKPKDHLKPEVISARSISAERVSAISRHSSPNKSVKIASPKKAPSATAATPTTLKRKSVAVCVTSPAKENTTDESTVPLQRRLTQKQPLTNTTNTKKELPLKKPLLPAERKTHQTSMSFSNSPAKSLPNIHKRRITSGAILSTSKPAFEIKKSSKPPTLSTFVLPGEILAEKLKAQKEAREEKMKQPKPSIAEQKAAKIKADREAREERVRLNQLKAQEAKVEKVKVVKAPLPQALTISKARAEAAERGRQASKEWAEKMQKKRLQQQAAVDTGSPAASAVAAS